MRQLFCNESQTLSGKVTGGSGLLDVSAPGHPGGLCPAAGERPRAGVRPGALLGEGCGRCWPGRLACPQPCPRLGGARARRGPSLPPATSVPGPAPWLAPTAVPAVPMGPAPGVPDSRVPAPRRPRSCGHSSRRRWGRTWGGPFAPSAERPWVALVTAPSCPAWGGSGRRPPGSVRHARAHSASSPLSRRLTAKAVAVLLPILGTSWVFGVLAVNHQTVAFQYIFAVLNSLQVGARGGGGRRWASLTRPQLPVRNLGARSWQNSRDPNAAPPLPLRASSSSSSTVS